MFLLQEMGWNAHWDGVFAPFASAFIPGRVRVAHRDLFLVFTAEGEHLVPAGGKLRHGEDWPVTGDWVLLSPDAERLEAILPRRTELVRRDPGRATRPQVIAANADVALLVMGLDHDYNLRRLERYLYLAHASGTRPIIVLNKADLCPDLTEPLAACEQLAPTVALSALHGTGLAQLTAHLEPGETAILLGSSGAGKSTIANRLRGYDAYRTQPVREHDSRGRHTTTHRELIPLELGWLLMDSPGLRELQLWGDAASLDHAFDDVAELAAACRFRDCRHQGEPGCAVAGHVDPGRWQSYLKLQRELAHLEREADPRARLAEKRRWKSVHQSLKRLNRDRQRE